MSRPPARPPALVGGPFLRSEAMAEGLTRDQLRGSAWRRLYRDVYGSSDLEMTDELWLAAARRAVPPDLVACGATAAWLHGVLRPHRPGSVPMDLATRRGARHVRRAGERTRRLQLDEDDVVILDGVAATSPARTCLDLSRGSSTGRAVVAVDAFLSAGLVTKAQLWRFCSERRRWPGIDRLREAVILGSDRVRSPAESELRMLLVLDGLPEPLVNMPLHDDHGNLVGIPDLLYLSPLLGIEYDGAYHRDPAVHQVDLVRENRLVTHGLPLLRYCAHDLASRRPAVLREVRAALRHAG